MGQKWKQKSPFRGHRHFVLPTSESASVLLGLPKKRTRKIGTFCERYVVASYSFANMTLIFTNNCMLRLIDGHRFNVLSRS